MRKIERDKLSDEEKKFSEDNYGILMSYMRDFVPKYEDWDEIYGIMAVAYIEAVYNYFRREELRKYEFSTVAYRTMNGRYLHYIEAEKTNKRKINKDAVSMDKDVEFEKSTSSVSNVIPSGVNVEKEAIDSVMLDWILKKLNEVLTDVDKEVLNLMLQELNATEIAKIRGCTHQAVSLKIQKIRELSRRFIRREQYYAY